MSKRKHKFIKTLRYRLARFWRDAAELIEVIHFTATHVDQPTEVAPVSSFAGANIRPVVLNQNDRPYGYIEAIWIHVFSGFFGRFFFGPFERLCRIVSFVPVLWRSVDFDAQSIFPLIHFKLVRVRRVLASKWHGTPEDLQAQLATIDETTELLRQFNERDYKASPSFKDREAEERATVKKAMDLISEHVWYWWD